MSDRSACRLFLVVALTITFSSAGPASSSAQNDEQLPLSTEGQFVVQTLSWKRSAIWTGDQFGPQDGNGRAWHHPQFDDSNWSTAELPHQDFDWSANDRYYRAHFNWDGASAVSVYFVSDDGL